MYSTPPFCPFLGGDFAVANLIVSCCFHCIAVVVLSWFCELGLFCNLWSYNHLINECNPNCLGQFREIPCNQTADEHRGSTLTLHNETITSQKPCQHNKRCDCSKTNGYKWSLCFVFMIFYWKMHKLHLFCWQKPFLVIRKMDFNRAEPTCYRTKYDFRLRVICLRIPEASVDSRNVPGFPDCNERKWLLSCCGECMMISNILVISSE